MEDEVTVEMVHKSPKFGDTKTSVTMPRAYAEQMAAQLLKSLYPGQGWDLGNYDEITSIVVDLMESLK